MGRILYGVNFTSFVCLSSPIRIGKTNSLEFGKWYLFSLELRRINVLCQKAFHIFFICFKGLVKGLPISHVVINLLFRAMQL